MPCLSESRTFLKLSSETLVYDFKFDLTTEDVWDTSVTAGTRSVVSSNVCYDPDAIGTNIRHSKPAGTLANMAQTFSSALDLSNVHGQITFYLPPLSVADGNYPDITDGRRFKSIVLLFEDSSANTSVATICNLNNDMQEGWKTAPVYIHDFPTVSGIDFSDITKILIQTNWEVGDAPASDYVDYDRFHFVTKPDKAKLLIRFDDGYTVTRGYCDTAFSHGLNSNVLVTSANILTGTNMTLADLQAVHGDGTRLVNHCHDIIGTNGTSEKPGWRWSDENLDTLTSLAVRRADVNICANYLRQWGFPEHAKTLGAPGGFNNPGSSAAESDLVLVEEGVIRMIQYAGAGQWGMSTADGVYQCDLPGEHEWAIRSTKGMDGIASATVQGYVDDIIAKKLTATFWGHQTLVDWETTCIYIKAKVDAGDLEIITYDDLVEIDPPATISSLSTGVSIAI